MKRMALILVLLIFVYIQGGYLIHTLLLRNTARLEFKQSVLSVLPDKSLTKFCLEDIAATVRWEENGKEFWYDSELYDVVRQQTTGDKTILYCLNDKKERVIVEQQTKLTKDNANGFAGKNLKTNKFTIPDFVLQDSQHKHQTFTYIISTYPRLLEQEVSCYFDILSPPPQC